MRRDLVFVPFAVVVSLVLLSSAGSSGESLVSLTLLTLAWGWGCISVTRRRAQRPSNVVRTRLARWGALGNLAVVAIMIALAQIPATRHNGRVFGAAFCLYASTWGVASLGCLLELAHLLMCARAQRCASAARMLALTSTAAAGLITCGAVALDWHSDDPSALIGLVIEVGGSLAILSVAASALLLVLTRRAITLEARIAETWASSTRRS